MSIKIMSWVLDHSPYEGKARLVHVVLADHANDDGVCWPSQEKIGKRAGCSTEHVRSTVKQMVADGYVEIISAAKGPGAGNTYLLKYPKSVGVLAPVSTPNPAGNTPSGAVEHPKSAPKGTVIEPSIEPSIGITPAEPVSRCPYCRSKLKPDGKHHCPAMNQLIR